MSILVRGVERLAGDWVQCQDVVNTVMNTGLPLKHFIIQQMHKYVIRRYS